MFDRSNQEVRSPEEQQAIALQTWTKFCRDVQSKPNQVHAGGQRYASPKWCKDAVDYKAIQNGFGSRAIGIAAWFRKVHHSCLPPKACNTFTPVKRNTISQHIDSGLRCWTRIHIIFIKMIVEEADQES